MVASLGRCVRLTCSGGLQLRGVQAKQIHGPIDYIPKAKERECKIS